MALLFQDLATLVQLQEPLKRLKDPYNVGAPDARFSEMGSHNLRWVVAVLHREAMQPKRSKAMQPQAEQSDATPSGANRCNPKRSKSLQGEGSLQWPTRGQLALLSKADRCLPNKG
jgi:hypothetical protein